MSVLTRDLSRPDMVSVYVKGSPEAIRDLSIPSTSTISKTPPPLFFINLCGVKVSFRAVPICDLCIVSPCTYC